MTAQEGDYKRVYKLATYKTKESDAFQSLHKKAVFLNTISQ